jgi:hypothetical protein
VRLTGKVDTAGCEGYYFNTVFLVQKTAGKGKMEFCIGTLFSAGVSAFCRVAGCIHSFFRRYNRIADYSQLAMCFRENTSGLLGFTDPASRLTVLITVTGCLYQPDVPKLY